MKISARNQLKGTITGIAEGAVNGVVTIDLSGNAIKADITMESIKELELAAGKGHPAAGLARAGEGQHSLAGKAAVAE